MSKIHRIGLIILFYIKTLKGISISVLCATYFNSRVYVSVTDASGRYNSQFFFGNDFWLGSHTQCQELQNTRTNAIVPPFRVNFHVAVLRLALPKELTPRVSRWRWVLLYRTLPAEVLYIVQQNLQDILIKPGLEKVFYHTHISLFRKQVGTN